jgi:hypothetical protein
MFFALLLIRKGKKEKSTRDDGSCVSYTQNYKDESD